MICQYNKTSNKDFIWSCYGIRWKKHGDLCENKIRRNEFILGFQKSRNKIYTEAHQWVSVNLVQVKNWYTGQKLLLLFLLTSNFNFIFSTFYEFPISISTTSFYTISFRKSKVGIVQKILQVGFLPT